MLVRTVGYLAGIVVILSMVVLIVLLGRYLWEGAARRRRLRQAQDDRVAHLEDLQARWAVEDLDETRQRLKRNLDEHHRDRDEPGT